MREYLRREADDGWIIDLSPEGLRAPVNTRIFPGVQHPICVGIFARRGLRNRDQAAQVRYLAIAGNHEEKLDRLSRLSLENAE
jgi:hypothetical protein